MFKKKNGLLQDNTYKKVMDILYNGVEGNSKFNY